MAEKAARRLHQYFGAGHHRIEVDPFHGLVGALARGTVVHRRDAGLREECRVHPIPHANFFRRMARDRGDRLAQVGGHPGRAITGEWRAMQSAPDVRLLAGTLDHLGEFLHDLLGRFSGKRAPLDLQRTRLRVR